MRPAVTVAAHVNKQRSCGNRCCGSESALTHPKDLRTEHQTWPQTGQRIPSRGRLPAGDELQLWLLTRYCQVSMTGEAGKVCTLYISWDNTFYCFTHIWNKGTETQHCSLNPTWRFKIGSGSGSLVATSKSHVTPCSFVLYLCHSFWQPEKSVWMCELWVN